MSAHRIWKTGFFLSLLTTAALGQNAASRDHDSGIRFRACRGQDIGSHRTHFRNDLANRWAGVALGYWRAPGLGDLGTNPTAHSPSDCENRTTSATLRVQILSCAPFGFAAQALGRPCAKGGIQVTVVADKVAAHQREGRAYILPRAGVCHCPRIRARTLAFRCSSNGRSYEGYLVKTRLATGGGKYHPFDPSMGSGLQHCTNEWLTAISSELASLHPH